LSSTAESVWSQRDVAGERSERGDRFGAALAGARGMLAVGVPGESIGRLRRAGVVHRIDGLTGAVVTLRRDDPGHDDRAGAAVAINGEGDVVVGIPGADIAGFEDLGAVSLHRFSGSEQVRTIHQGNLRSRLVGRGNAFGSAVAFVGGSRQREVLVGAPGVRVDGLPRVGVVHLVDFARTNPERGFLQPGLAPFRFDPEPRLVLGEVVAVGARRQWLVTAAGGGPRRSGAVFVAAGADPWVELHQGVPRVPGRPRRGDAFGAAVS
jgi:hypothetical protein